MSEPVSYSPGYGRRVLVIIQSGCETTVYGRTDVRGTRRVGRGAGRVDRAVDGQGSRVGTPTGCGFVELISSTDIGCTVGQETGEAAVVAATVGSQTWETAR